MTIARLHSGGPAPYGTDEARWRAILERDRGAENRFVYAVRTTGVFCRPWCPSRRPLRENVSFYSSPSKAMDAGFRACLRCRPEGDSPRQALAEVITRAVRSIEASERPPAVGQLARESGMSPAHFRRSFKSVTGLSPKHYADAVRAERVRSALGSAPSVSAAVFAAGYQAPSRFYANAGARLGMKPDTYRRGAQGETIRFAVGESSLGTVLVAATDRGVCEVQLGSEPGALLRGFQDRYPAARLIGKDPDFEALVARVVGHVENPGPAPELPLDIRGTAFQESVWRALGDIPPGETRNYAEIARAIGRPAAARAIGAACAANRVGVLVPCHRVVRTDGGLGGYRWGVERKAELLRRERETGR